MLLRKVVSMKVAALDPGKHCGFAFMELGDKLHQCGLVMDDYHYVSELLDMIDRFNPNVLVIEDFRLSPHKAMQQSWDKMETPRIIGILDYWAWQRGLPVIFQQPSTKQAFPDARLKKMGLYQSNIHTRDAIRHGLYFLHFGLKKRGELP